MTDSEIIDAIKKSLIDCEPIEPDNRYYYTAEVISMADGFWRGFLTALLKRRTEASNHEHTRTPIF